MKKFEPPNTHHLSAAEGWLELGDAAEAGRELKQIAPELQKYPEVLAIWWQIHAKLQKWKKCVEVWEALVRESPDLVWGWIHRSFALHELGRTQEALDVLLPALKKFPEDWLVRYNLSCYSCRLRKKERALFFLEQACKLGNAGEIKAMAGSDTDLQELRGQF